MLRHFGFFQHQSIKISSRAIWKLIHMAFSISSWFRSSLEGENLDFWEKKPKTKKQINDGIIIHNYSSLFSQLCTQYITAMKSCEKILFFSQYLWLKLLLTNHSEIFICYVFCDIKRKLQVYGHSEVIPIYCIKNGSVYFLWLCDRKTFRSLWGKVMFIYNCTCSCIIGSTVWAMLSWNCCLTGTVVH